MYDDITAIPAIQGNASLPESRKEDGDSLIIRIITIEGLQIIFLIPEFNDAQIELMRQAFKASRPHVASWLQGMMSVDLRFAEQSNARIRFGTGSYFLSFKKDIISHHRLSDMVALIIHEFWHPYIDGLYPYLATSATSINSYIETEASVAQITLREADILNAINDAVSDSVLMIEQIRQGYYEAAKKYAEFYLRNSFIKISHNMPTDILLTNILQVALVTFIPFAVSGDSQMEREIRAKFYAAREAGIGDILSDVSLKLFAYITEILSQHRYPYYPEFKKILRMIEGHNDIFSCAASPVGDEASSPADTFHRVGGKGLFGVEEYPYVRP